MSEGKFTDKFKKKSPLVGSGSTTETASTDASDDSTLKRDKNNFTDHLIRSRNDLCYKVMGRDSTGRTAWYFILLDKDKKDQFLKHQKGDSYDLADYGKIIASGYGEDVPEDVQEMLKEKYGFDNF